MPDASATAAGIAPVKSTGKDGQMRIAASGKTGIFLLAIALMASSAFSETQPDWQLSFEEKISSLQLMPSGRLLVCTAAAVYGVDPERGEVAWRLEWPYRVQGAAEVFFEFEVDLLTARIAAVNAHAFRRLKSLPGRRREEPTKARSFRSVVDVEDGRKLWDFESTGVTGEMGHLMLHETGQIMICGVDTEARPVPVSVAELMSGELVWKRDDFFRERPFPFSARRAKGTIARNQSPIYDTSETMITFMDKDGVRKHNAKTGELIWKSPAKVEKDKVTPRMILDRASGVVYVPYEKAIYAINVEDGSLAWKKAAKLDATVERMHLTSQGLLVTGPPYGTRRGGPYVMLLRATDGKPLWKRSPKLRGRVQQMVRTGHGLLLRGTPKRIDKGNHFVALIDTLTGEFVWEFPERGKGLLKRLASRELINPTDVVIRDDEVIIYGAHKAMGVEGEGKLYAINLADGSHLVLAESIKFEGDEIPLTLELRRDGYLLRSSQSMALFDFSGSLRYHVYLEAPEDSWLKKGIWMGLEKAAGALYEKKAGYSSDEAKSAIKSDLDRAKNLQGMQRLVKGSTIAYAYILTPLETDKGKQVALVKINKDTGEMEQEIYVATKEPEYLVDDVRECLFLKTGDQEVSCFR